MAISIVAMLVPRRIRASNEKNEHTRKHRQQILVRHLGRIALKLDQKKINLLFLFLFVGHMLMHVLKLRSN